MGCGASRVEPVETSSKAWAATLALMEEADRARQAAARAEARLRHLQQRVAHEVELDAPRLPKQFREPRTPNELDSDMRHHAESSDWWWMADTHSGGAYSRRPLRPPAVPPPPTKRRAVLPPLEG